MLCRASISLSAVSFLLLCGTSSWILEIANVSMSSTNNVSDELVIPCFLFGVSKLVYKNKINPHDCRLLVCIICFNVSCILVIANVSKFDTDDGFPTFTAFSTYLLSFTTCWHFSGVSPNVFLWCVRTTMFSTLSYFGN